MLHLFYQHLEQFVFEAVRHHLKRVYKAFFPAVHNRGGSWFFPAQKVENLVAYFSAHSHLLALVCALRLTQAVFKKLADFLYINI